MEDISDSPESHHSVSFGQKEFQDREWKCPFMNKLKLRLDAVEELVGHHSNMKDLHIEFQDIQRKMGDTKIGIDRLRDIPEEMETLVEDEENIKEMMQKIKEHFSMRSTQDPNLDPNLNLIISKLDELDKDNQLDHDKNKDDLAIA